MENKYEKQKKKLENEISRYQIIVDYFNENPDRLLNNMPPLIDLWVSTLENDNYHNFSLDLTKLLSSYNKCRDIFYDYINKKGAKVD